MSDLETLPNIGKVLAARLQAAGIGSSAELRRIGDAAAFRRLRTVLPDDACVSTRLALAGAVRGVRWHDLEPALRQKLAAEARG